jgi:pSer/pThr/pTyr-binding forkhead associated (FHA) protein
MTVTFAWFSLSNRWRGHPGIFDPGGPSEANVSMAALYQIGNDGSRVERWEFDREPVVVGRSGQVKVSIKDEGVSRRHFLIRRDGEDYVIQDLNSRNGTWVHGRRVFAEKLHHNDCILAGRTAFLFADRPALSTSAGRPLTGPNGTVMISALRSALAL